MSDTDVGTVLIAKYRGTCLSCRAPIAKGAKIVHKGRGNTRHEECAEPSNEDVAFRFTTQRGYTGPGRQRCEDAPCCGCC